MITLILCIAVTLLAPDESSTDSWLVILDNGRVLRAKSVVKEKDTWVLTFASGTMIIQADDVREVKRAGTGDEPAVNVEPANKGLPAKSWIRHDFELGGTALSARLPKALRHDEKPGDPGVVTYVSEAGKLSVRFAWTGESRTLWGIVDGVRRHHREAYTGFRILSERFTMIAKNQVWLLTFRMQRRGGLWQECQGFLLTSGGILVVTVTAPDSKTAAVEAHARAIIESLKAATTEERS